MTASLKVYVAGKPKPRALPNIPGVVWLEPYVEGLTEKDSFIYTPRDLVLLYRADMVLAVFEHSTERNTCTEIGIAYERRIPIIGYIKSLARDNVTAYGFTLRLCTSVVDAWQDAERIIRTAACGR